MMEQQQQQLKLQEQADKHGLKRELGVWSAAAIVVGTVIGSGIFLVPSTMARNVGSPFNVFVVWIAGGLLSLFGALSYAELAAAMPEAGGEYVYLREAYGPCGPSCTGGRSCGSPRADPSPLWPRVFISTWLIFVLNSETFG